MKPFDQACLYKTNGYQALNLCLEKATFAVGSVVSVFMQL